jgi:hypothetical protein
MCIYKIGFVKFFPFKYMGEVSDDIKCHFSFSFDQKK